MDGFYLNHYVLGDLDGKRYLEMNLLLENFDISNWTETDGTNGIYFALGFHEEIIPKNETQLPIEGNATGGSDAGAVDNSSAPVGGGRRLQTEEETTVEDNAEGGVEETPATGEETVVGGIVEAIKEVVSNVKDFLGDLFYEIKGMIGKNEGIIGAAAVEKLFGPDFLISDTDSIICGLKYTGVMEADVFVCVEKQWDFNSNTDLEDTSGIVLEIFTNRVFYDVDNKLATFGLRIRRELTMMETQVEAPAVESSEDPVEESVETTEEVPAEAPVVAPEWMI
jgi:hypothetical protein